MHELANIKDEIVILLNEAPRHKAYVRVALDLHEFLNLTLNGGKWSNWRPGCFTLGEAAPGARLIGCWLGSGTASDALQKRNTIPQSFRP